MLGLPDAEHILALGITDGVADPFSQVVCVLLFMCAYGFLLFKAAQFIGTGSEMLLLLYGPGIIGGLVIPILGAVPDGAIILASGLGAPTVKGAQCQIAIGIGTLAGSTIMLLTVPFAASIFLGWRDADPSTGDAATKTEGGRTKPKYDGPFSFTKSVITTYPSVPTGGKIMIATSASYLILQIPAWVSSGAGNTESVAALVGMIICIAAFIGYAYYQLRSASADETIKLKHQQKKFEAWKRDLRKKFGGAHYAIDNVFDRFDTDHDGSIDVQELTHGLGLLGLEVDRGRVNKMMDDMDQDHDHKLTKEEFRKAVYTWIKDDPRITLRSCSAAIVPTINGNLQEPEKGYSSSDPLITSTHSKTHLSVHKQMTSPDVHHLVETLMGEEDEERKELEEEMELGKSDRRLLWESCGYLLLGTVLCVIFSDPMCDAIDAFHTVSSIPSFFVSFVLTPLASNAAEVLAAIMFARKKTNESISLTVSSLYGAATLNNTFCLAIFCALIHFRGLAWTFTSETIVTLFVILVVGILGWTKTIVAWKGILIGCLYPLSIILIALGKQFDPESPFGKC